MSKTKWGKKYPRAGEPEKKIGNKRPKTKQPGHGSRLVAGRRCGSDPPARGLRAMCPQGESTFLAAAARVEKAARSTPDHLRHEVHVYQVCMNYERLPAS